MQVDKRGEEGQPQTASVRLDVHRKVRGKVKQNYYWLHTNFQTEELTLGELASCIRAGNAYTAPFRREPDEQHKTTHFKANVLEVPLLWLDVETGDERATLDWWQQEPFVRDYAAIVHTTASHRAASPRCRVLFMLDRPLDVAEAEEALAALFWHWPFVDQSVKDANRTLYGARGCDLRLLGHVLPVDVLHERMVAPYQTQQELARLEDEQRRLEAARQDTLERLGRPSSDSQTFAYVSGAVRRILDDLAAAQEGTGERHGQLLTASIRLFSFKKATWLDIDSAWLLGDVEGLVLDAATTNGYVKRYGREDTLRIIRSGEGLALPALEPIWKTRQATNGAGSTNKPEVSPSDAPQSVLPGNIPPPPPNFDEPPPEAPPPRQEAEDEGLADDDAPDDTLECTCAHGSTNITIRLTRTTISPNSKRDRRHCPFHKRQSAHRFAQQLIVEQKRHELTLTEFDSVGDWTRTRKKWNQWTLREKDKVAFRPFVQEDGRVLVFHSSQEDDGEPLPAGEDELEALLAGILAGEHEHRRSRATAGFGGQWQGTRNDGRAKQEERETGQKEPCYQLVTGTQAARVAKRAYGVDGDARGRASVGLDAADSYLNVLDWWYDEKAKGQAYTLEERHEHRNDNPVVRAIFDDERVTEAIKYYRTLEESKRLASMLSGEVSSLLPILEPVLRMGNKDYSQAVEVGQTELEWTTDSTLDAVVEVKAQPPPRAPGAGPGPVPGFLHTLEPFRQRTR